MIREEEIIAVGKTTKAHGVQGEVSCEFTLDFDWEACKYFVFDMDSIYVPFFIESMRPKNDVVTLVKFDGYDTESAVRELCNKTIFVKRDLVDTADELELDYFIGFEVIDKTLGTLGTIDDVDDSTSNALFAVGDKLIPACNELITDIDHDKKQLFVDLPEGLVTIND